ncbi:hypothetical protein EDD16DRAFT_1588376 [Pisolithus croceorrhizus]|nr:hypothetical protein EDD16DRAFT_1588376 [Pisolithus croceorrhizus]KAI6125218.1 hypothetical protein EV401DRAFT_1939942 [Pisolithus croceorrhizus]KAI6161498.1 hypothetical protein EDD17DRAFT_1588281 [Pisolithus thermaeus]
MVSIQWLSNCSLAPSLVGAPLTSFLIPLLSVNLVSRFVAARFESGAMSWLLSFSVQPRLSMVSRQRSCPWLGRARSDGGSDDERAWGPWGVEDRMQGVEGQAPGLTIGLVYA